MRTPFRAVLASFTVWAFSSVTHAAAVVTYSFTNSTLNATSTAANVTAGAITAAPTVNGQQTTTLTLTQGIYASAPFITAARANTNESAVRANDYIFFTLSATAGNKLNLSSFTFNVAQGGGNAGEREYDVRTSVDNYALSLSGTSPVLIASVRPNFTNVNLDLDKPAFQGLSTITFQIRYFTPGIFQNVDMDDLIVNGAVVAPEPTSAAAILIGGVGLLRRRHRRHAPR